MPQPISLIEVKAYLDLFGAVADIEAFVEYIQFIDEFFMSKRK